MPYIPAEEELKRELEEERRTLEERLVKSGKEAESPTGKLILESIR